MHQHKANHAKVTMEAQHKTEIRTAFAIWTKSTGRACKVFRETFAHCQDKTIGAKIMLVSHGACAQGDTEHTKKRAARRIAIQTCQRADVALGGRPPNPEEAKDC
jgi:hypothetical protein